MSFAFCFLNFFSSCFFLGVLGVLAVYFCGMNMLFFGRKKRLIDYASCAG
jgi:hypothetical protein